MITDRIGRREVLLPISHEYYFPEDLKKDKKLVMSENSGFWDLVVVSRVIILQFVTGSFEIPF